MKKPNQKFLRRRHDGYCALRVYHRKAHDKQSARLLIKCGDCDEKFESTTPRRRRFGNRGSPSLRRELARHSVAVAEETFSAKTAISGRWKNIWRNEQGTTSEGSHLSTRNHLLLAAFEKFLVAQRCPIGRFHFVQRLSPRRALPRLRQLLLTSALDVEHWAFGVWFVCPPLTRNACHAGASRRRIIREVSNSLPEEIDLLVYA